MATTTNLLKYYGNKTTTYTQVLVMSSISLMLAAAVHYRIRRLRDTKIIPRLRTSQKHKDHEKLERFSHYVARQMGFKDRKDCPNLCKLAADYNRPKHSILHADTEPKRKLKQIVMAATREQRINRVTKNLKVARVFNTLVEEMRAMGIASVDDSQCTEVMEPVAHKDRSPVLLLMGGGMGAGKSTVLKDILKEAFWAGADAVVIEADAFKESDVIYRALSSRGHVDMIQTAELVHQSSTDAASSLLVTALNEGRDVIMDGTLSWVPFVVQTITMARNVHRHHYRMGPGYKVDDDGVITEDYWERIGERQQLQEDGRRRKPYRIELVGVVCDAYLAVIRGIRRAIICRRAVRVRSQLRSHKRFADAFPTYCSLVDGARLYCTNALEGSPKLIGWKEKEKTLLVDPEEIDCLKRVGGLNENADSIYQLYSQPNPACEAGSIWKDIVLSPSRFNIQQELKYSIQKVERSKQQQQKLK
ncbi:unnamed protein product [Eruca vesicaria subsp. sativa]|uniref:Zeta toxin domain-containing protein n=1 Tax=Eruca vesicaria subsp. sativa TaxID=29727 RepID=A0ABC8M834_ERUVS|nr:unnamed protein product [Eruca vesicaria subsp. sativa]